MPATAHAPWASSSPGVGLALVVGATAALACCDLESGRGQRSVLVDARWELAREVDGHRVHVLEHRVPCAACHALTDGQLGAVVPALCVDCHEAESRIEHALERAHERFGPESPGDCFACHAFTADEGPASAPSAWDCLRCHDQAIGETPAVTIHTQGGCDTCHRPHHDEGTLTADCQSCHEEVRTTHAAKGKEAGQVCTTCHQKQHGPAADARTSCAPCHAEEAVVPKTALFEGHHECTGCHRPHDYEPQQAIACRTCHAELPVLGGGRIREHEACGSCHQPHAVKTGMTEACLGCHDGRQTDHPGHAGGSPCAGCHEAHPARDTRTAARSCSHCHHEAPSDTGFHGATTCSSCHQPHMFKLEAEHKPLCSHCHGPTVAATRLNAGHATCGSCHGGLPHRPGPSGVSCNTCHGEVAARVVQPHADCASCHEPHGGKVVTACTSCHAETGRRAPAGHRVCASCHEPHDGKVRERCQSCHAPEAKSTHGGIPGECATCHTAHGPDGVTRAPGCETCHAPRALPGLHQVEAHRACAQCHTSTHQTRLDNQRAECLSCHREQVDHFTETNRCSACHLFE